MLRKSYDFGMRRNKRNSGYGGNDRRYSGASIDRVADDDDVGTVDEVVVRWVIRGGGESEIELIVEVMDRRLLRLW